MDDARDPRRCAGTSKQTGEPCGLYPVPGATVCKWHGGGAPQVRAAARRRLAEREAATTLAEVGVYPVEDPVEAFATLVSEVVALKDHFADRVAQLESLRYTSTWNTEQMRTEVALYERALDRAGRLLAQWVSLGLDERRVQLGEAHGRQINEFLVAVLRDLGLTGDPRLPAIIQRHAAAMTATGCPAPALPVDLEEHQPIAATSTPVPSPVTPELSEPSPPDDDDMAWARFDDGTEA